MPIDREDNRVFWKEGLPIELWEPIDREAFQRLLEQGLSIALRAPIDSERQNDDLGRLNPNFV